MIIQQKENIDYLFCNYSKEEIAKIGQRFGNLNLKIDGNMKGKLFDVKTFSSEGKMLDFINEGNKEPVSVIQEGYTYKLYYLW